MVEQKVRKFIVYQITNKINKMIYIGVHVTKNTNDSYMGSGRNIKKAIKEFGLENFEKIVLYQFDNKEEMLEKEKELVNREFIARQDTYNIIVGGGVYHSIDTVTVKDKDENYYQVHKTDPRYLNGELVSLGTGKIVVKNKEGNKFQIDKNDPRYISGELESIWKNMIITKDKEGNFYQINKNDHRYISGELVHIHTGIKKNKEWLDNTKKKFKEINHQQGEKNSQFGTCWIYKQLNENLFENKKIKKEELNTYLEKEWIKGRKKNK